MNAQAPAVRGSGTILIVRVAGDENIVTRLRAELASSAWDVVEVAAIPNEAALSGLAAQHDATAAVRCDVSRGLELWVAGATDSSPGSLDVIDLAGVKRDPGEPAWRAMETLRARGLRFSNAERAVPSRSQPSARELRAAAERRLASARERAAQDAAERARRRKEPAIRRRIAFELGPAYGWSPGGLRGSVNGWAAGRFDVGRWSLSAVALVPLTTRRLTRLEGEAQISTFLAAAVVDLSWAELGRFRLSSGLGLGPSVTTMSGTARAGYVGSTVKEWLPTGMVRSSLRVALGSWVTLGGSVLLGATTHPISVNFGDRGVATWGQPWIAGVLSLEATLGS